MIFLAIFYLFIKLMVYIYDTELYTVLYVIFCSTILNLNTTFNTDGERWNRGTSDVKCESKTAYNGSHESLYYCAPNRGYGCPSKHTTSPPSFYHPVGIFSLTRDVCDPLQGARRSAVVHARARQPVRFSFNLYRLILLLQCFLSLWVTTVTV